MFIRFITGIINVEIDAATAIRSGEQLSAFYILDGIKIAWGYIGKR